MRRLLAVAGAVAALACPGAASAGGPFLTGVFDDNAFDGPGAATAFARVHDSGASVVRLIVPWQSIAPARRPAAWHPTDPRATQYDWEKTDAEVRLAVAAGLQPLLDIVGIPDWAQVGEVSTDAPGRPRPADLGAFAGAVARRYSGRLAGLPRVTYFMVWNEPNISNQLSPQYVNNVPVSPSRYLALLNAASNAIHAAHPGALVVAGGLSPFTISYPTVDSVGPLRFMRELLCMTASAKPQPGCRTRARFDIWAMHPYTSGGPFHHAVNPDDVSLGDLGEMKTLLDAAARAGHIRSAHKPAFWVTEFSWDSRPPDPKGVPMPLLTRWTAEAAYQMWRSGVSLVTWYLLQDKPLSSSPFQSGLYTRGGLSPKHAKPMLAAFRFPFVAYRETGRVVVWGRAPAAPRSPVQVQERAHGAWRNVGVLHTDAYGVFRGSLRGSFTARDVLRAGAGQDASPAFSLTRPPDRIVRPFG